MKQEDINIENHKEGDGNMYYGAAPILFELAKELRGRMTAAEAILWNFLKINEWHLKFRRQHPIAIYVADFYCHKLKLVIELDGGYHENMGVKIYDGTREKDMSEFGIKVLRFKNEEVINNIKNVLANISDTISSIQKTKIQEAESSNNSPLGDGGEAESQNNSPLGDEGEAEFSNNSPLGDGGVFVIKIGGNVIDDDATLHAFLKNFASINAKKILVHGGGKIATKIGEQLGIQSNYINGRRITDAATIDLVTMVYGGLVNKKIVAKLQSMLCNAIGLTGADANMIPATKRPVINALPKEDIAEMANGSKNSPSGDGGEAEIANGSKNSPSGDGGEAEIANGSKNSPAGDGGEAEKANGSKNSPSGDGGENANGSKNSPAGDGGETYSSQNSPSGDGGIDYGFVGDINPAALNLQSLQVLLANNLTPVFAPLTHDGNGQMLNTNADTIASTLAIGLSEIYDVRLIYCFEKKGVLENVNDENSVIRLITKEKYRQLMQDKKLFEGILPKIDNAFAAIDNGVREVLIGDANDLLQNVTIDAIGTLIK